MPVLCRCRDLDVARYEVGRASPLLLICGLEIRPPRLAPGLSARLERDTEDVHCQSPAETAAGWRIRSESPRDPRGYGNGCRAMVGLNQAPLDPELPRIRARTLIVASELDQRCPPRAAEIVAAGIAGSHLVVLPDAGHPIPVELPQELARLILDENPDG